MAEKEVSLARLPLFGHILEIFRVFFPHIYFSERLLIYFGL